MLKSLSSEEQEALFQALVRKIPSVSSPSQLQEGVTLALALMLRRPSDRQMRDELTRQVTTILAQIHPDQSPERTRNEVRYAAHQCIKVLQAAKDRRLPRGATASGWAQADSGPAFHAAARRHIRRTNQGVAAVVALAIAAGGGILLWHGADRDLDPRQGYDATESPLTAQIRMAADGAIPVTHVFGGTITVDTSGGSPVVIAEGIPPKACVTAGWQLVRKGTIAINGVAPLRVSAARITELCNRGDGDATIVWRPKAISEP